MAWSWRYEGADGQTVDGAGRDVRQPGRRRVLDRSDLAGARGRRRHRGRLVEDDRVEYRMSLLPTAE